MCNNRLYYYPLKKRVFHLTTSHSSSDTRVFYRECKSLLNSGYEVFYIAPHTKEENVEGINIIPLPKSRHDIHRRFFLPFKIFFLCLRTNSSVFHFHDPELIPVGVLLKLCTKGKVVYDVHEDYPSHIFWRLKKKNLFTKSLSKIISFIERFSSTYFFDAIVVNTSKIGERFPSRKVVVLRNFPTCQIVKEIGQFYKPFEKRSIDIIHSGSLGRQRFLFLLEIFTELRKFRKNFSALLLGLNEKQRIIYKRLIPFQLKDNIHLEHYVPFSQVKFYLTDSKIGINYHPDIPPFSLTFPTKFFEYLAAGCITLSAKYALVEEMLANYDYKEVALFVEPDPRSYAESIHQILDLGSEELERRSVKAKELVKNFLWERAEAPKLLELYEKLTL